LKSTETRIGQDGNRQIADISAISAR